MDIAEIVEEAAALADSLADSPIYFKSRRVADGVEALQQAAAAFRSAENNAARKDAALWLGEAYLLLSSGLPDTGHSEHATGWATANQIARLLGGPWMWDARVNAEFGGDDES